MLYIIQSRYPIIVADVNLCVVGIKQCLSSKFKKKYKKIIVKNPSPPKKGAQFQYVGNLYARLELKGMKTVRFTDYTMQAPQRRCRRNDVYVQQS